MSDYVHHEMFPIGEDGGDGDTPWRKLTGDYVQTADFEGETVLKVDLGALTRLAAEAFKDISHLLRASHLEQLARILDDKQASDNDRFVAMDLLKNANIAAGGVLPMCQDTGTAIILGKKGQDVWTNGDDEAVVVGRFRVVEDTSELFQVPGAEQMRNVLEGLGRQQGQGLEVHFQHRFALERDRRDEIAAELAPGRVGVS